MVYQGSKDKLAKFLTPIIEKFIVDNNIDTYIEPFCGGANMIDKINCANRYGYDYNDNVITLLKYAQQDNSLSIAPNECTFEHYREVRDAYNHKDYSRFSKEYISLIGYMASYGGRFFDGGYGRDSKGGRSIYTERLANFKKQSPNLTGIIFECKSFDTINPSDYNNCLFYLDPPYKNTKKYAKQSIDYEYFYKWCKDLAKNNIVLISEFDMPKEFECIWQKDRNILQKSDRVVGTKATERLYKA